MNMSHFGVDEGWSGQMVQWCGLLTGARILPLHLSRYEIRKKSSLFCYNPSTLAICFGLFTNCVKPFSSALVSVWRPSGVAGVEWRSQFLLWTLKSSAITISLLEWLCKIKKIVLFRVSKPLEQTTLYAFYIQTCKMFACVLLIAR